jgi:hypothetical protein
MGHNQRVLSFFNGNIQRLTIQSSDPAAADGYALGVLLHTVFNSPDTPLPTLSPPHPPPSASSRGSIPFALFNSFKRLLNPNPKNRLTPKKFLELGMSDSGFFQSNNLVKICLGLDNFVISNEAEKSSFLRQVSGVSSTDLIPYQPQDTEGHYFFFSVRVHFFPCFTFAHIGSRIWWCYGRKHLALGDPTRDNYFPRRV